MWVPSRIRCRSLPNIWESFENLCGSHEYLVGRRTIFVGRGFSHDIRNASDKFSFRQIFRRAFRSPRAPLFAIQISAQLNPPRTGLPSHLGSNLRRKHSGGRSLPAGQQRISTYKRVCCRLDKPAAIPQRATVSLLDLCVELAAAFSRHWKDAALAPDVRASAIRGMINSPSCCGPSTEPSSVSGTGVLVGIG
jgi:hypothetical protein